MGQKVNTAIVKKVDLLMEVMWLGLIFALPLLFFPNIYTTFELAKVVVFKGCTTLLFLLWVLKCWIGGGAGGMGISAPRFEWRKHKFLWLSLAAFLGFYLLATLTSVAPALSFFGWYPRFQGLMTVLSYVVFGVVIFFELRSERQRERLILALMSGFLLVCAAALMQKFLPGFLSWWNDAEFNGRIYGTMGNPDYLANYLVMLLPLVAVSFWGDCIGGRARVAGRLPTAMRGRARQIFAGVCLVAGIATLFFTLSRAGILAAILSLLFLLGVVAYKKRARKLLVAVVLLPLVLGGFIWYVVAHGQENWVKNVPILARVAASAEGASSMQTRLEIWPAVVRQILASPAVGYGPETFAVTFPLYAPASVNGQEGQAEIADRAHNEILDTAVQIGIPGMIAYVFFILGLVGAGARFFVKTGAKDTDSAWTILALSCGVLGLFIANQFGFSVTVHWVFLTFFAAVILNFLQGGNYEFQNRNVKLQIVFCVVAILSVGYFLVHDVALLRADFVMRQGYDAEASAVATPIATNYYTAAAKLAPPMEAFYSLNLAYAQLQRLNDVETLSVVEKAAAYKAAVHAANLRGNDRFASSVAEDLQKFL